MQPLLTDFQRARLEANGRAQAAVKGTIYEIDLDPVVRLVDHETGSVYLLTEIDPDQPQKAWGLCLRDPDYPEPHMGQVDLLKLTATEKATVLTVDRSFTPSAPVSDYLFRAQAALYL
jgi:hypothetical protein